MYRLVAGALAAVAWPIDGIGQASLVVVWGIVAVLVGTLEMRTAPPVDQSGGNPHARN